MPTQTPHFKTEAFEGPLDLLLQLIEEKKLPVNEIALAEVTEQFLQHLKTMEDVAPEILANFLVIAGKLLVIKSRALLPALELEENELDDGLDLAQQLLLLKKYREAARMLQSVEGRQTQSFTRDPFLGLQAVFFPDPAVSMEVLHEAARGIVETLAEIKKIPQHSVAEVISISEKIEHLQSVIGRKVRVGLSELIKTSKSRTEVVVTFLAVLELVKQRILTVDQEELFADIMIEKTKSAVPSSASPESSSDNINT